MLLGILGVFFALCVIALAVMFGRRTVRFGGILVMFGCLIMFVSSHWIPPVDTDLARNQVGQKEIRSEPRVELAHLCSAEALWPAFKELRRSNFVGLVRLRNVRL